jgi:hypothetical protein
MDQSGFGTAGASQGGIPLEDFDTLADNAFAMEWKQRFQIQRIQMIPDIARWLKVLRYFAPRRMEDHWQDQYGMPLKKLAESEGLSLMIANWCQPMIEVYGSLLAGQKPWPFGLDVRPSDAKIASEMFRADAQEKLIMLQMEQQAIPLHFLDFCVSVMMFGIGWVYSWMDDKSLMLKTQAISWPGDVVPQWGSNRYGRGGDALESVILVENMSVDAAMRLYPGTEFVRGNPDMTFRPDSAMQALIPGGSTQILKVWYRWYSSDDKEDKIGYAELANSGTREQSPAVLKREDDTEYPDIPVRWSSRFNNPGEAPHKSAGILDNIVGINTEYNERLSAFSDLLMKFVYPKLKGKNYNQNTIPRLSPKNNVVPLGMNQDLNIIQDIIQGGQAYFDSFFNRIEHFMLSSSGLTSIMMGSLPPGETSNAALETMIHSSLSRLEVVRTPIQWAWLSLFQDIWVPLLYKWGSYSAVESLTGKKKQVDLKQLFDRFSGFVWTWPDVTPRDALRMIQTTMDRVNAGMLSRQSGMRIQGVASPIDELAQIRAEYQDSVLNPDKVRLQKLVEQMSAPQQSAQTEPKLTFTGKLDPQQIADILVKNGIDPKAIPGVADNSTGLGGSSDPNETSNGGLGGGGKGMNGDDKFASAQSDNLKAKAAGQPALTNADNTAGTAKKGSQSNAAQGVRSQAGKTGGVV